MRKWTRMFFAAVLGVAFVAGAAQLSCAGQVEVKFKTETNRKVQMGGEKSLYDRLGGKKAITAVVDQFVAIVAADARINKFFAAATSDPKRMATFKGTWWTRSARPVAGPASTRANL